MGVLDVVSHEYGHAITQHHTGLSTDYGIESSMKEGFSDIWGAVIGNEIAPDKDAWKIGEEVIDVSEYNCLRNIEDPESTSAYDRIADTYGDAIYSSGNFYAKSGIMSHWFYLLAEGGSGTNDNNDDYLVYGLGIDVSAQIVFEGQTGHFGSVDTYLEARTAMIDAAEELYGENSLESMQVANAWYAVGVGGESDQVVISGEDYICSSYDQEFTIEDFPSGYSFTWDCSSNITREDSQGSNPCTFSVDIAYQTSGWIEMTSGNVTIRKTVALNPPPYQDTEFEVYDGYYNQISGSGMWILEPNAVYEIYLRYDNTIGCSLSNYDFNLPTGFTLLYDMGNGVRFRTPSTENSYYMTADAQTCCGYQEVQTGYLIVSSGMYLMVVSPNPSSGETIVTLAAEDGEFDATQEWEMEVYDMSQSLKAKKEKIKGKEHKINVSGWKKGIYIVRAKVGDQVIIGKLAVE